MLESLQLGTPGDPLLAQPALGPRDEGRRARRWRELHERISQTARALFLEQGFEATTVEQIADAADIAQATFFNHFPTKDAVVGEMAGEVFERFRGLVEEQRRRRTSTQEQLLGFAERGARVVEGAPELTRRMLLEVMRSAARPGDTRQALGRVQHELTEMVREGQARGDVHRDRDPEFLAELVLSVVHGSIVQWMNDDAYPLRSRMREAAAFMGDALVPRTPERKP